MHGITSLTAWQANPADILAGNRGPSARDASNNRERSYTEDLTDPARVPSGLPHHYAVINWIGGGQEQVIWASMKRYLETRQQPS